MRSGWIAVGAALLTAALIVTGAVAQNTQIVPAGGGAVSADGSVSTALTECIHFEMLEGAPPGDAGGTESVHTAFSFRGYTFGTGVDTFTSMTFRVPDNYESGSAVVAYIEWFANHGACSGQTDTDDVCWNVDTGSFAADDSLDGALGGTAVQVTDNCTLNNTLLRTSVSIATPAWTAGDLGVIFVQRDGDNSTAGCTADNDQFAQTAVLGGLTLCYEADNVFNGE